MCSHLTEGADQRLSECVLIPLAELHDAGGASWRAQQVGQRLDGSEGILAASAMVQASNSRHRGLNVVAAGGASRQYGLFCPLLPVPDLHGTGSGLCTLADCGCPTRLVAGSSPKLQQTIETDASVAVVLCGGAVQGQQELLARDSFAGAVARQLADRDRVAGSL